MQRDDFWNNKERAVKVSTELSELREEVESISQIKNSIHDLEEMFEILSEEEYAFSNMIAELEAQMETAARNLQFEKAAAIRDKIKEVKETNNWDELKANKGKVNDKSKKSKR